MKKFRRYEWVKIYVKGYIYLYKWSGRSSECIQWSRNSCRIQWSSHIPVSRPLSGTRRYLEETYHINIPKHIHTKTKQKHTKTETYQNDMLLVLLFIINADVIWHAFYTNVINTQALLHIQLIIHHTTQRKHTMCKVNSIL